MSYTIPNEAAAAFADQAEPDKVDFDILAAGSAGTGVVSGCAVTAHGPADMGVAVAIGVIAVSGTQANVAAGDLVIGAADPANPRFDLIVVSSAGVKSVTAGTAAANPVFPTIPANSVVLAAVYVPALDAAIDSNQIVDKRVLVAVHSRIQDADNDTWIDVENAPDQDIIRMTVAATLRYLMQGSSPHHQLTGDVNITGGLSAGAAVGSYGAYGLHQLILSGASVTGLSIQAPSPWPNPAASSIQALGVGGSLKPTTGGTVRGLDFFPSIQATLSPGVLYQVDTRAAFGGTNTITTVAHYRATRPVLASGRAFTNLYGLFIDSLLATGTGTVTNFYGSRIEAQTVVAGVTLTNRYGHAVGDLTQGAIQTGRAFGYQVDRFDADHDGDQWPVFLDDDGLWSPRSGFDRFGSLKEHGQQGRFDPGSAGLNAHGLWDVLTLVNAGGALLGSDVDGRYYQQSTSAVIGNEAYAMTGAPVHRRDNRPLLELKVSWQTLTSIRFFAGLTDQAAATMAGADNPAGNYVGVQFSTPRADANWQFVSKDNVTQNLVNSGVAIDANVHYIVISCNEQATAPEVIVELFNANHVLLVRNRFVANLPVLATPLYMMVVTEAQAASARTHRLYYGNGINRI